MIMSRRWVFTTAGFSIVDSNNGTNHFREDDHVSEMGLYNSWLFQFWAFFLGLPQALEEGSVLPFQATVQATALASGEQFSELLMFHVQELFKINTSIGEGFEGPTPWLLLFGHIERW